MMAGTYYQQLGVDHSASQTEIAAAYRRLARRYHPDRNPEPDAKHRMQALNAAYAVLRDPARRRHYDATLDGHAARPVTLRARPTANSQSGHPGDSESTAYPRAWLNFQQQVGDVIVLGIQRADDMSGLLRELQRRIPVQACRYNPATNRWHVAAAYADTLCDLFYNYAPVVQPTPATVGGGRRERGPRGASWVAAPHRMRRPTQLRKDTAPLGTDRRSAGVGLGLALVAALFVYGLLLTRVGTAATNSLERTTNGSAAAFSLNDFTIPDDCAALPVDDVPTYLREACSSLLSSPEAATGGEPVETAFFTATTYASNIRSGPGTRFPILTTVAPNVLLRLTAYNSDGRHVWYRTGFGGWIRGDLVRDMPDGLPFVPVQPPELVDDRSHETGRYP